MKRVTPFTGCGSFFVVSMELFFLFFLLWTNIVTVLALVWYINEQQDNMYFERQDLSRERERLASERTVFMQHAQDERKDLYDRLMAGTLPQYKEHEDSPSFAEEKTDDTVDLIDAKDDLMGVNNEQQ